MARNSAALSLLAGNRFKSSISLMLKIAIKNPPFGGLSLFIDKLSHWPVLNSGTQEFQRYILSGRTNRTGITGHVKANPIANNFKSHRANRVRLFVVPPQYWD